MKHSTQWGITSGAHDASIAVVRNNEILFAAHAERSSRKKNDAFLNSTVVEQAMEYGYPDQIYWYENHWKKRLRQISAGQYRTAFTKPQPITQLVSAGFDMEPEYARNVGRMMGDGLMNLRRTVRNTDHHHSHAAAGYYTSPFEAATVVVIDSIGEWETLTIWRGEGKRLTKVFSQEYPHSVGLWYSAMTQRIGLKPNEDEYILMGWAALGNPYKYGQRIMNDFAHLKYGYAGVEFKRNLHRGCRDWAPELNTVEDYADIAAGTQLVYQKIFEHIIRHAMILGRSKNLVLMGGCALNCVANPIAHKYFNDVWIMPNPGDAGSSIGCIAAHNRDFVNWTGPYLGYNIEGKYPTQKLLAELETSRMAGCANGRAEYGPRALGNRTLFADPRGEDVQDLVNTVKKRQSFRPFAPVILEKYAQDYFDGHTGPYMQYTSRCKRPDLFPAITHTDDTSRVQTVNERQHPELYDLLTKWHAKTGCPMLLNTSLNIKGEPMVDTEQDAQRWHNRYGVKVFTRDD